METQIWRTEKETPTLHRITPETSLEGNLLIIIRFQEFSLLIANVEGLDTNMKHRMSTVARVT